MAARLESDALKIVYLENYEWRLASMLTAGVDLWLNTPRRPIRGIRHQRDEGGAQWRPQPQRS